jgi:hypothetical protein
MKPESGMREVAWADLDPLGHTSFSFYDFMPGAGLWVRGAPAMHESSQAIDAVLRQGVMEADDASLDQLAALLLNHGHELEATEAIERLSVRCARAFAELIGSEPQRARRMRLTRLSLMLRAVIDASADLSSVTEDNVLPCPSPWDIVESTATDGASAWVVNSGSGDNIRLLRAGHSAWSQREGLPTQLDVLDGSKLSVGSYYSAGAVILDTATRALTRLEHTLPVLLCFDQGAERFALDSGGWLWRVEGGALAQRVVHLGFDRLHRARVVNNELWAFDWGTPDVAVRMRLDHRNPERVTIGPVMVCNDLCAHQGALYVICKLQGKVFKFSQAGEFLEARLGAGVGTGRLLDPITIRADVRGLSVINWFSARLVRLRAF